MRFVVVFFCLQWAWGQASGGRLAHWVVEDATVRPCAALINWMLPQAQVRAEGAQLQSSRGSLNVRDGCEGTEMLFLLLAALSAAPLASRRRLSSALLGGLGLFALNQVRLAALFWCATRRAEWFDAVHGLVAPLVLVLAILAFVATLGRGAGAAARAAPQRG